jgi:hypothetical protein
MGETRSINGKIKNAYNILDEKSEGNRPPGRPMSRWKDINTNLKRQEERAWSRFIWLWT